MFKSRAFLFLATLGGIQAQTVSGTWVGAFDGPGIAGGLELTLHREGSEWSAQARVRIDGRLHSEPVDKVSIGEGTIEFRTIWEGRELRVTGAVNGNRLRGSVAMAAGTPDRLVRGRLDLIRLATSTSDILPPPTGPFPTGRSTFRWIDETRDEASTMDPSDKRELLIHLWYPTEHRGRSPYLLSAGRVLPFLPKGTADVSANLELPVSADALIFRGRRYSVAVFSPGKGVNAVHYSSLYQDLASRGFVVAAIDHPYDAPVVVFPGGRSLLPLPKQARPPQEGSDLDLQHQAADFRARDILSVRDALAQMNADPHSPFVGRFDLSKLFAVGHSLGGMAAFRACQLEPSIVACVNIDGGYRARPYPATVQASGIEPAFLWLRRPLYEFTDTQLKQVGLTRSEFEEEIAMGSRVMRAVVKGGFDVRLPHAGIDHMDFSDVPLLQKDISPSSRAARSLTVEMMRSWVRDFLEASVDGRPSRVLTETSAAYREARITAYR